MNNGLNSNFNRELDYVLMALRTTKQAMEKCFGHDFILDDKGIVGKTFYSMNDLCLAIQEILDGKNDMRAFDINANEFVKAMSTMLFNSKEEEQ